MTLWSTLPPQARTDTSDLRCSVHFCNTRTSPLESSGATRTKHQSFFFFSAHTDTDSSGQVPALRSGDNACTLLLVSHIAKGAKHFSPTLCFTFWEAEFHFSVSSNVKCRLSKSSFSQCPNLSFPQNMCVTSHFLPAMICFARLNLSA